MKTKAAFMKTFRNVPYFATVSSSTITRHTPLASRHLKIDKLPPTRDDNRGFLEIHINFAASSVGRGGGGHYFGLLPPLLVVSCALRLYHNNNNNPVVSAIRGLSNRQSLLHRERRRQKFNSKATMIHCCCYLL